MQIKIELDDDLLKEIDATASRLGATRSELIRDTLRKMTQKQQTIRRLESKHRQGYARHPVGKEEFRVWEEEPNGGGIHKKISRADQIKKWRYAKKKWEKMAQKNNMGRNEKPIP